VPDSAEQIPRNLFDTLGDAVAVERPHGVESCRTISRGCLAGLRRGEGPYFSPVDKRQEYINFLLLNVNRRSFTGFGNGKPFAERFLAQLMLSLPYSV